MRIRSFLKDVRVTQKLHFLLGKYEYTPLPTTTSIRLLEILPSTDRKAVQCALKVVELDGAPPFQALSYTWGSPLTSLSKFSTTSRARRNISVGSIVRHESSDGQAVTRDQEHDGRVRRCSIICDGSIVKVTANLRDALRMLGAPRPLHQPHDAPKYFWIDALCVDQKNISERNAQVARMASIFKASQNVVVWLGIEDEFTADALTTIDRVSKLPEKDWLSIKYTSFYQGTGRQGIQLLHLSYRNWLGFITLINRPWFKRAWVVQEIALGKSAKVICGSHTFDWDKLSKTLSFIKATRWYHHLHTDKLRHLSCLRKDPGIYKRVLQSKLGVGVGPIYLNQTRLKIVNPEETSGLERNRSPSLHVLLDTHRFAKSTDPRDKIYAFIGLADKKMMPFRDYPQILKPNYRLSVQEVYTQAAKAMLLSYTHLSLLSHVQDPSRTKTPNLPSWVPDYSVDLDPYPLKFRGPGYWKAGGNLKWDPNVFSMDDGHLDVQGYQLDTIDRTAMLKNESKDPAAFWASIVSLSLSLDLSAPKVSKMYRWPSRMELLWRTLTTNVYNKQYPAPSSTGALFIEYILNLQIRHRLNPWSSTDDFQPHHTPLSESIYPEWTTLLSLEPPGSPYCLNVYRRRLASVVEDLFNGSYSPIDLAQLQHEFDQSGGRKRRLFRTRTSYMGTGPRSLQKGDELWILHGAGTPFVLRHLPNGNYQLIGEAYVYGVMHGEINSMELPRRSITLE